MSLCLPTKPKCSSLQMPAASCQPLAPLQRLQPRPNTHTHTHTPEQLEAKVGGPHWEHLDHVGRSVGFT